ncbi:hypothetical protein TcG_06834 [Trypanosoma cruzi]|nr:hypothetical protein TcG_06834 [Trypanosoma cruzi]
MQWVGVVSNSKKRSKQDNDRLILPKYLAPHKPSISVLLTFCLNIFLIINTAINFFFLLVCLLTFAFSYTTLLFTIMMKLPFYYWKTSLNPDASLLYGTDQCDRQEEPVPVISHLPSFRVPTQAGTWQAAEGCHPFLVRFNNMVQENAVCRQHVMRSFLCM